MHPSKNAPQQRATRHVGSAPRARRRLLVAALILSAVAPLCLLARRATNAPAPTSPPPAAARSNAQVREQYGRLPLSFEANRGQAAATADFLARGAGYTLALSPTEAAFALGRKSDSEPPAVLRMNLVGANRGAGVEGLDELEGKANYFTGSDPTKWRENVPTYGRVRYSGVYPGVDLVYYGNQRQLEYDFVVAPGSDARSVELKFEGADKVEVDAAGDLLLTLGEAVIRQPKPVVYQEVAGARRAVEGGYAVAPDGSVGFRVGDYDRALPLVIDPVLAYSTYLGGGGTENGNDIAVDSGGAAYVCGDTTSTNFPTANAIDSTFNAGNAATDSDAFVTKLNAAGNALVYSTYLGGTGTNVNLSGQDVCRGIAVDSGGNAYVVGQTRSTDFPTANAIQSTYGGGLSEGFLAKLNAAGNALVYSTYLGGDTFDEARDVAVDSAGNAYVAGRSTSSNFPTVNPIQSTFKGGGSDATITKINAAGTAFIYSTYLGGGGGNAFDAAFSIALDSSGNAYITGQTSSTDFPTANAIQSTYGGGFPDGDAFVAKLNAAGNALVYSTYLGGNDNDIGFEIAVDSAASAYVVGVARSANFPVANAFQSMRNGASDAFVTKINAAGSAFVYSTYLGGSADESGNGIAVNPAGNAYVVGGTTSTDFPTANSIQNASGGDVDIFATKFNAAGSALLYSTYLGGSGFETALDMALDSAGSVYFTGRTNSTNYPTLNPFQSANGGGTLDAFVTKISDPPAVGTVQFAQATYTVAEGLESGTAPASLVVTVTRTGDTTGAATVDYRTLDSPDAVRCDTANGTAYHRCDYATTIGTLSFAAGETQKTFSVFITDDTHVEGNETFQLGLSNAVGTGIGAQMTTTVTITDNDTVAGAANPIDTTEFFVRQHYIDFLTRAPDSGGFNNWVGTLNGCGSGSGDRGRDPACDRPIVSSAFFRSEEFLQITGYYAYRFYEVSFDRRPTYDEFVRDFNRLTGTDAADAAARQTAFAVEFTNRPAFVAAYPASMTLSAYVDALFATAELGSQTFITRKGGGTLTRAQLADGTRTRAEILREIVESQEVAAIFYNRAFVAAQYFGYLRRDPEPVGYQNWLNTLNANPSDYRGMVAGFINSREYRLRFGKP